MLADAHELQPIVALLRVCLVLSLAEKPKLGELQMDWLRSEDLREEKNVTAPSLIMLEG